MLQSEALALTPGGGFREEVRGHELYMVGNLDLHRRTRHWTFGRRATIAHRLVWLC